MNGFPAGIRMAAADSLLDTTTLPCRGSGGCGKAEGWEAIGIGNISGELLKVSDKFWLHQVLNVVWQYNNIPSDKKKHLVIPTWRGKEDRQSYSTYRFVPLLRVRDKGSLYLLMMRALSYLLKFQKAEHPG